MRSLLESDDFNHLVKDDILLGWDIDFSVVPRSAVLAAIFLAACPFVIFLGFRLTRITSYILGATAVYTLVLLSGLVGFLSSSWIVHFTVFAAAVLVGVFSGHCACRVGLFAVCGFSTMVLVLALYVFVLHMEASKHVMQLRAGLLVCGLVGGFVALWHQKRCLIAVTSVLGTLAWFIAFEAVAHPSIQETVKTTTAAMKGLWVVVLGLAVVAVAGILVQCWVTAPPPYDDDDDSGDGESSGRRKSDSDPWSFSLLPGSAEVARYRRRVAGLITCQGSNKQRHQRYLRKDDCEVGEESGDEDDDDDGDGREAAAAAAAAASTPEDDFRSNTTLILPLLDHDGNASTSCVQVDASGDSGAHDQDRRYEVLSGDDSGVEEVGWSSYVPPSARHTGESLVSDHEVDSNVGTRDRRTRVRSNHGVESFSRDEEGSNPHSDSGDGAYSPSSSVSPLSPSRTTITTATTATFSLPMAAWFSSLGLDPIRHPHLEAAVAPLLFERVVTVPEQLVGAVLDDRDPEATEDWIAAFEAALPVTKRQEVRSAIEGMVHEARKGQQKRSKADLGC